ncbi:type II toxin-antitoxin system prevent-host-death family antitoxin [Novosphingobium sp. SG707]|uniref:type II toxin-antitoxin system prevent-host-death family antitoxin n=1 Tax=Novosphingobium sp. SG707 TaxID=2586996 RepID=UPI001447556E|nr:prevent-host-death family protein [Novosphingobium sp. SG707]
MTVSFLSSRDFNRDPARAKRAAKQGPVFVTERSKPALVVLSIEEYERLAGQSRSLADMLMPAEDLDFPMEFPNAMPGFRPAEFD